MNMPGIPLTHSFFQLFNLKNRINMMNKQPSHSKYRANYFLFFPVLIFLFATNSHINSTRANGLEAYSRSRFSTSDTVHSKVDQMPVFGEGNQLGEYLGKQITYPGKAKKEKKEGTVFVEFVIDQKGAVTQVRVSKGVSAELDEEALRVVREMPSWTPGRHRGKAVQVKQVLPIRFALAKE
jgi:TonB family protein